MAIKGFVIASVLAFAIILQVESVSNNPRQRITYLLGLGESGRKPMAEEHTSTVPTTVKSTTGATSTKQSKSTTTQPEIPSTTTATTMKPTATTKKPTSNASTKGKTSTVPPSVHLQTSISHGIGSTLMQELKAQGSPVPAVDHLGFGFVKASNQSAFFNATERFIVTHSTVRFSNAQILIATGSFLGGIFLVVLAVMIFYCSRQNKRKHKELRDQPEIYSDKTLNNFQAPCNDFFLFKQGLVENQTTFPFCNPKLQMINNNNMVSTGDILQADTPNGFNNNNSIYTVVTEQPSSKTSSTTFKGLQNPFINQFSGYVDYDGGEIRSETSDVSVTVPQGAIPPSRGQQKIYVNVALGGDQFNVRSKPDEIQLAPVVECLAPGLSHFEKPVTIKIPHRADMKKSDWEVAARFSQSELSASMPWQDIPQNNDVRHQVVYEFDDNFVYVKTFHFTTFTCVGCGGKKKALKLCGVVFGNDKILDGRQQVNFRVYITDGFLDSQQRIVNMEKDINGECRSQYKPLLMYNHKDWEINFKSAYDPDWAWELISDERVKVIQMDICYHCCGTPPSVDFRCIAKDPTVKLTGIEAVFQIAQTRRHRHKMVSIDLITHDFQLGSPKAITEKKNLEFQMTQDHMDFIESNLLASDVGPLCRTLGLTEAEISQTRHDCQLNIREEIHQLLLLWRSKSGERATLEKFVQACRKNELNDLADILTSSAA